MHTRMYVNAAALEAAVPTDFMIKLRTWQQKVKSIFLGGKNQPERGTHHSVSHNTEVLNLKPIYMTS